MNPLSKIFCVLTALVCQTVVGQVQRQALLDKKPLAEVDVQSFNEPQEESYGNPNVVMRFRSEQEDPLSFYARTQDGEWQIPAQVNSDDPWVRLLLLGPGHPTTIDVAIEINQQPYRAAREKWIDKLLSEAKATFLVRTGAAAAEAVGITKEETEEETKKETEEESEEESEEETAAEAASEELESEEVAATEETTGKLADDDSSESEEEIPMVTAQSRKTSTLFKRLINYLAADQSIVDREASREELRWLLAEWTGGPALLTLSPAFAWRRADTAPLWNTLDRDGNQVLSSEEIRNSTKTLRQADINHDDMVDLDELQRLGKDRASRGQTKGYPLVVVLDENTNWKVLKKYLRMAYGPQPSKTDDFAHLSSDPADMVYRVSFANEGAKLTLLTVNSTRDDSWRLHSTTEEVITVEQQASYLELAAAQGEIDEENTGGDMKQTQVAIGGVVDGYPLFRLLDHDSNRQLTQRESRDIADFLTTFDRNQDGQIERHEIPTAIRLAVTHGPLVHQHLSRAVTAQREHSDQAQAEAPAWFAGMDRNRDGDLSKREFQGSPAQFATHDRDGDGLISSQEAQ